MKKYLLVLVCAVLVLAVAGCSKKNQLKCTGEMDESGVKIKAEVVADFDKDDKLTDAVVYYDLGSKETADQYCSFMKMMEDSAKGVSISCSGSKITIKGYAQMDDGEEKLAGTTKDDFVKAMQREGLTCK